MLIKIGGWKHSYWLSHFKLLPNTFGKKIMRFMHNVCSFETQQIVIISCDVDQTLSWQSWLCLVTEDPVDGRRARTEAAADGSWMWSWGAATVPTSSSLRGSFQRGLSAWSAYCLILSLRVFPLKTLVLSLSFSGGLLDMHGAHVYLLRQILQIRLFLFRRSDSRGDFRENNISCEFSFI